MRTSRIDVILLFIALIVVNMSIFPGHAKAQALTPPSIRIDWETGEEQDQVSRTVQIIVLITVLSLAPAILVMMTSFTRIVIVFSFLRHALGTQQIPPTQVMVSFALFLTFFTMLPTINKINADAVIPYREGKLSQNDTINAMEKPLRDFMFRQTREKDLELFIYASGGQRPRRPDDVPTMVLIPSFVLSELRTGFVMGFTLFITFLVIDMVVASILMSMGMFMLPPMMISLPMKVMLFVLVDGWYLVVRSIIFSFR